MYNWFPDGLPPAEDDALFAWLYCLSLVAFQAMPYVFGLQSFFGWEVTKPKLWVIIGFGLATVFTLSTLAVISVVRWILDRREARK